MNQFKTDSATRRSFLRSAGGAMLAVPFLETLASAEAASAAPQKRMIFLGGGFGFTAHSFYPKNAGQFSKMGMTEGMKPLERHAKDITMVSNITNDGANNPHGGSINYLTCAQTNSKTGFANGSSISCDQVAAEYLGTDTRFASLVLAGNESSKGNQLGHDGGLSLSWNRSGKPMPAVDKPTLLYRHLFGAGESAEKLNARLQKKQSILDIVKLDSSSLKRTLSNHDQEKLDEYFTGVRQLEKGLERQAEWANKPLPRDLYAAPDVPVDGEAEIRMMYDMIVVALQTDSTRVASYRLPVRSLVAGLNLTSAHSLSHYRNFKKNTLASQKRDEILMKLFAHFLDRLKEAKDVDGSRLYDNCIVSYGTNLRTGHVLRSLPAILSGGGAKDIKHGRHIVLPKKDTPLSNYWLTLLQQADLPVSKFSSSTGNIPELLG